MASKFRQGPYKVKNRDKYIGDVDKVVYRSSWEMKCMKQFDMSSNILAWNSEEIIIPYTSPKDSKYHRYFMDFLIVTRDDSKPNGKRITLIEVKPKAQTFPPKASGKKKSRYLQEAMTYEVNIAKWKYAKAYCDKRGWYFLIMTEDHIF
jgi:hypothetical protein